MSGDYGIARQTTDPRDLAKEIHAHMPGLTLYSGAKTWTKLRVFGRPEHFPPDLGGKLSEHPWLRDKTGSPVFVRCDGKLTVRDRHGILRDRRGNETGFGPLRGENVTAIVTYVTSHCAHIVWLRGDAEDKARMQRARENWHKNHVGAARDIVRTFREATDKFVRENPGLTPKGPTERVREAQKLVKASEQDTGWKEYKCPHWDADYDTYAELRVHMIEAHNQEPKRVTSDGKPVPTEDKPVPTEDKPATTPKAAESGLEE
jgi:hypothetical protein